MSVLSRSFKQTNGYFVPLGNCKDKVYSYTGTSGAGGSTVVGNFATVASWATSANNTAALAAASTATVGVISSILSGPSAGGLFKDMGKTVVSASRTFRKVQLVFPGLSSTGGVADVSQTTQNTGYLTGYIELAGAGGFAGGVAAVAPVAYLPGLM